VSDALPVFRSANGESPLVISFPHVGTELPPEIGAALTPRGRGVEDTDWHVNRLYAFARDAGAASIEARLSRYAIDLNRPPGDEALYPGQASTGLCPTHTFDGEALYAGANPDAAEIARRRERYWAPYHAALRDLLAAARRRHGFAVLLDAHSIRSEVPRLFSGRLPDINVGTNDGRSCAQAMADSVMARLAAQQQFTHVLNGRFKGGYITRAYGDPAQRVHAFEPARAAALIATLRGIVERLLEFRPAAR
jgi:N-formylglutamate deformylase